MTALTEQESDWVDDLAGRLRLIQAGAAGVSVEKRREYLQEEVSRRIAEAPPGQRKRYLSALASRFPVCGRATGPVPAAPVPTPERPVPKPVEETPDQILDRFLAAAAKLPEERRSDMARRLAESGLAWIDRDALVLDVSEDLRKKLGLPEDQQLRLTRLVDMGLLLIDTFAALDKRALATLSGLSPKNKMLQRSQTFRTSAARFLASEGEPLEPHVRAVTALLGALMAATLAAGREFGGQHWNQFSPEAIEGVVQMEGGGKFFGPSVKERCWDKYAELANRFAAPAVVEKQTKDCLARIVDKILEAQ